MEERDWVEGKREGRVDSDAQLEQGRRLDKAGPVFMKLFKSNTRCIKSRHQTASTFTNTQDSSSWKDQPKI